MKAHPKTRACADALVRAAQSVARRIGDDGEVLGWHGCRLDLDAAEGLVHQLRLLVRGVDPDERTALTSCPAPGEKNG